MRHGRKHNHRICNFTVSLPGLQTLKTVKLLVEREGWQGLPLYAWGGSAGGTFAARLPYYLRMEVRAIYGNCRSHHNHSFI